MSVINCHVSNLRKIGYKSLEEWLQADPKNHIYIGRKNRFVNGAEQSKWHNPYPVSEGKAVERFETYIRKNKILMNDLKELRGKTLACWCKPNECHGDVLQKLLAETTSDTDQE